MLLFSDLINHLNFVDIAFEGMEFAWNNMQDNPLLQKLDQVFTSSSWTLQYPHTIVITLSKPVFDHVPYVVKVGTEIPKAKTFRFENYWLQISNFLATVELHQHSTFHSNSVKTQHGNFKKTRRGLKTWSKNIAKLNKDINKYEICHQIMPQVFNGAFTKKCWTIVKTDFMRLWEDFSYGLLDINNINGYFIVLVPKMLMTTGLSCCLTICSNYSLNQWRIDCSQ